MDEIQQKRERLELLLRYASVLVSVASFWIIALFGGYYNADELELIPRLGLAAALSWVVLLHGEAMGMIIMSLMKEKWQREAREEALRESRAELRESQDELRESRAELRESQDELRESRAELRESREREAQQRETIHELRRRLARRGDNGADGDEVA